MKNRMLTISLLLNLILVAALFTGLAYTHRTLLQMESLCAEAESARLGTYVSILESDREDRIESVTSRMSNAIKDNEEGWPSVKAPDWCWRP